MAECANGLLAAPGMSREVANPLMQAIDSKVAFGPDTPTGWSR